MTLESLAIIAIVYILLMVVLCLFMRGCKSEEDEPMGEEAGKVYPVSIDNKVKKW